MHGVCLSDWSYETCSGLSNLSVLSVFLGCAWDFFSCGQGKKDVVVPEDIGRKAAYALLEEVSRGGVCDSAHQVGEMLLAMHLRLALRCAAWT